MVEKKELPAPPRVSATLGELSDVDKTVESLKMEFLMRLQSQDYITANQI